MRSAFSVVPLWAALCIGCGASSAPEPPGTPAAAAPEGPAEERELFPQRKAGWAETSVEERERIAAFAQDYVDYLARARTGRRAVSHLIDGARGVGARPLGEASGAQPGDRFFWRSLGGHSAVLVRTGTAPLAEGIRVIVAGVDAPHLALTPNPVYQKAGLSMFDTSVYGDVALEHWLVHPLALSVYRDGPRPVDIVLGDAGDSWSLSIPDLLPHLSGKVQRKGIVDSPERMDAIAAHSARALERELVRRGLPAGDLGAVETELIPAREPFFVGVDRALIGGHGHESRALAFAGARAMDGDAPVHTTLLVLITQRRGAGHVAGGLSFVREAVVRCIDALSDSDSDSLDQMRVTAASMAVIAGATGGEQNRGLAVTTRRDDALPRSLRRVLTALRRGGAAVQLHSGEGSAYGIRVLSALDMDAVEIGLHSVGSGTPVEVISAYDLYQAHRALRSFMDGQ